MRKKILFIILTITICVSCSKIPITKRRQMRLLPEYLVSSLALTAYNDFMNQNKIIPINDEGSKIVKNVGDKMSDAVNVFLRSSGFSKLVKKFSWEYHLVDNNTVNAWCMPGGKIVFYSGILPYTRNESGLAVVMGHEMAHAVARHGNERMSQQLAITMGGIALSVAMQNKSEETKNIFLAAYGIGGTLGTLAYSRNHEYEADKIGMVFMAISGYDPIDAISFWERMNSNSKKTGTFPFLSTHPSDEKRIEEMKKFLPKAQSYYKH